MYAELTVFNRCVDEDARVLPHSADGSSKGCCMISFFSERRKQSLPRDLDDFERSVHVPRNLFMKRGSLDL